MYCVQCVLYFDALCCICRYPHARSVHLLCKIYVKFVSWLLAKKLSFCSPGILCSFEFVRYANIWAVCAQIAPKHLTIMLVITKHITPYHSTLLNIPAPPHFFTTSGVIPESLGGLVSLQTIHLSNNQLTGMHCVVYYIVWCSVLVHSVSLFYF